MRGKTHVSCALSLQPIAMLEPSILNTRKLEDSWTAGGWELSSLPKVTQVNGNHPSLGTLLQAIAPSSLNWHPCQACDGRSRTSAWIHDGQRGAEASVGCTFATPPRLTDPTEQACQVCPNAPST